MKFSTVSYRRILSLLISAVLITGVLLPAFAEETASESGPVTEELQASVTGSGSLQTSVPEAEPILEVLPLDISELENVSESANIQTTEPEPSPVQDFADETGSDFEKCSAPDEYYDSESDTVFYEAPESVTFQEAEERALPVQEYDSCGMPADESVQNHQAEPAPAAEEKPVREREAEAETVITDETDENKPDQDVVVETEPPLTADEKYLEDSEAEETPSLADEDKPDQETDAEEKTVQDAEGDSTEKNGFYQNNNTYAWEHDSQNDEAIQATEINEDSVTVMELNPVNPENPVDCARYSMLSFSFDSDGKTYCVTLTGLKSDYASKFVADKDSQDYADSLQTMKVLACNFINSNSNGLRESNRSGADNVFAHNLVDAEKISQKGTDSLLCWAASAADMLWMAGWAPEVTYSDGTTVFKSEDELFNYFKDCFVDDGSRQDYGIKFFFNGISMDQAVNEDGSVLFENRIYNNLFAQQKTKDIGSTLLANGVVDNIAAENVYETYMMEQTDDFAGLVADKAIDAVESGNAVGFTVAKYKPDDEGLLSRSGGHSITLMGFIRELGRDIADAIKGIFIADPDDDKDIEPANPAERDNNYAYYDVEKTTVGEKEVYKMLDYDDEDDYFIDGLIVLKNKQLQNVELEPDEGGTRTPAGVLQSDGTIAQASLDLIPVSLSPVLDDLVVSSVEVGDEVSFKAEMKNISYKTEKGSSAPVVHYAVEIYKDGSAEPCSTLNGNGSCGAAGITANETLSFTTKHRFTEPGNYEIRYSITGVSVLNPETGEYCPEPEAFVSNNRMNSSLNLIVLPMTGGQDGTCIPAEAVSDAYAPYYSPKEKIYTGSFACIRNEDMVIEFECKGVNDASEFEALFENFKIVDPYNYSIAKNPGGTFSISFSAAYLKTLCTGSHEFCLVGGGSRTIFKITII